LISAVILWGVVSSALAEPPAGVADTPTFAAEELSATSDAPEEQQEVAAGGLEADESVLLNFERGDIREVIHSLATALGLSYTIDPRVEGQVTIRTIGRIAKEDLFPVFNQILRNNGIAAVQVGEVYQIVPVGEAKTRAILPPTAATRSQLEAADSFVIEIVPCSHVAAEEMTTVLEPFITPGGDVFSYPRGNLLIVTDLASNVERLRDLVRTLDVDTFRGMRTRVYKIQHGDLDIITEELAVLLASYGHAIDGSTGLSLIPMPRLESLTAISFDATVFDEIGHWLDVLDISPDEGAGRKVRVYHVENSKAADLADLLNELFGDGGGGGGGVGGRTARGAIAEARAPFGRAGRRGGITGATAQPLTRSGSGRATAARQVTGATSAPQLSGAQGRRGGGTARGTQRAGQRVGQRAGGQRGARGRTAGAAGSVVLAGARQARGIGGLPGPPPVFKEEVRIVADEVTNSLIVLSVKQDYEMLVDVLRKLDVVPRQVVIEVVIADVTLDKNLEFGVDHALRWGKGVDGVSGVQNLNPLSRGTPIDPGEGGEDGESPPLADSIFALPGAGAGGLAAFVTDKEHFAILLRALASRSQAKLVSAPHIIAADNREAHIVVGREIPILTGTSTSVLTATNVQTAQVQYRATGTILTILPQVNSAGLVNMQVRQEVSGLDQEEFGATGSPSFRTREAETTVVVQNGDSVLIGGIIDEQRTAVRRGVPFIMDIPVIGRLFRFEGTRISRVELIVLITPHVIRSRDEALSVSDKFKRTVHGLERILRSLRAPPWRAPLRGQGEGLHSP
jgi:general secretion pathway protein D